MPKKLITAALAIVAALVLIAASGNSSKGASMDKYAKPSEIISKLDFLAAEVFRQGSRLIDENFLVQQGLNA